VTDLHAAAYSAKHSPVSGVVAAMMTEFLDITSGDLATTVLVYGSIAMMVLYTLVMIWIAR
jgi:hypothetical protein